MQVCGTDNISNVSFLNTIWNLRGWNEYNTSWHICRAHFLTLCIIILLSFLQVKNSATNKIGKFYPETCLSNLISNHALFTRSKQLYFAYYRFTLLRILPAVMWQLDCHWFHLPVASRLPQEGGMYIKVTSGRGQHETIIAMVAGLSMWALSAEGNSVLGMCLVWSLIDHDNCLP